MECFYFILTIVCNEIKKLYHDREKTCTMRRFHLIFIQRTIAFQVVQLYETMMTRHTTMIVGPTGGGKSVVINTLAQAQTK